MLSFYEPMSIGSIARREDHMEDEGIIHPSNMPKGISFLDSTKLGEDHVPLFLFYLCIEMYILLLMRFCQNSEKGLCIRYFINIAFAYQIVYTESI
jgi:hypothetical protein